MREAMPCDFAFPLCTMLIEKPVRKLALVPLLRQLPAAKQVACADLVYVAGKYVWSQFPAQMQSRHTIRYFAWSNPSWLAHPAENILNFAP